MTERHRAVTPGGGREPRPVPVIERELGDVERYLAEAPPHSGHGARDRLDARRAALQRELTEARRRGH